MSSVRIYQCGGIVVEINRKRFLFDAWGKCDGKFDAIFISHAHLDHVSSLSSYLESSNTPVYLTRETYEILRFYDIVKGKPKNIRIVKVGEEIDLTPNTTIGFLNAGHVAGSLMFRLESPCCSIGYTGDFNFEGSIILEPAELLNTDILVIDTTYGSPKYSFPPRSIIYEKIRETISEVVNNGKIPILHGYALGKGQELTKVVNTFLNHSVGVDSKVGAINRIYERFSGIKLGNYRIGELDPVLIRGISKRKYRSGNKVHIFFTGWAMTRRFNAAMSFPLSSHTGFIKLLDYIVKNDPKVVYPVFGFEKSFSRFIKHDLKVKAEPLPKHPLEIKLQKIVRKGRNRFYSLDNFI